MSLIIILTRDPFDSEVHAPIILFSFSYLPLSCVFPFFLHFPSLINIIIKDSSFFPLDIGVYAQMIFTSFLAPTVSSVLLVPMWYSAVYFRPALCQSLNSFGVISQTVQSPEVFTVTVIIQH